MPLASLPEVRPLDRREDVVPVPPFVVSAGLDIGAEQGEPVPSDPGAAEEVEGGENVVLAGTECAGGQAEDEVDRCANRHVLGGPQRRQAPTLDELESLDSDEEIQAHVLPPL